eukprot:TRINITY_DN3537_c0_g1_i1.p1 TRINITY_DN3537_c0_g1~~TRINITY_DN3537_c0_g1_i1.p1  ORF type:complete len:520 (+),score=119.24 TRINITY_DN3537_c0_g1_i1:90-1562(+)
MGVATNLLCLLIITAVGLTSSEEEVAAEFNQEDAKAVLSDEASWLWAPPSEDNRDASAHLHSMMASWCGDTYEDAVTNSMAKEKEFARLKGERDSHFQESIQCLSEKGSLQQDLTRACIHTQVQHNSSHAREMAEVFAEFEQERAHMRADVDACEMRAKRRVEAVCNRDAAKAQAACTEELTVTKGQLELCTERVTAFEGGRCAQLEVEALTFEEDKKMWAEERKRLELDVIECRPAKAQAEARLKGVLADGRIASLETTVMTLQVLVLVLILLLMGTASYAVYLLTQEGRGDVSGGSSNWALAPPTSALALLTADQAKDKLQEVYETRQGQGLSVILTTTSEAEAGVPLVFLLVPVNVTTSRRFALFGGGGDFTGHIEKASEFVARTHPRARLIVILYEYMGCVFTQQTLQLLRLTADKVADAAVPANADFPARGDICVLYAGNPAEAEGLLVSDFEGSREMVAAIKDKPWAQYLWSRAPRVGSLSLPS